MDDITVRFVRTFRLFPSASSQQEFQNLQYVPIEQRRYQDMNCVPDVGGSANAFEDTTTPTNMVLHFRQITSGNRYKTLFRHL